MDYLIKWKNLNKRRRKFQTMKTIRTCHANSLSRGWLLSERMVKKMVCVCHV